MLKCKQQGHKSIWCLFSRWHGATWAWCFVCVRKRRTTREVCQAFVSTTMSHETLHGWPPTSPSGCCSDTEARALVCSALWSQREDAAEEWGRRSGSTDSRGRRRRSVLCLTHWSMLLCLFACLHNRSEPTNVCVFWTEYFWRAGIDNCCVGCSCCAGE